MTEPRRPGFPRQRYFSVPDDVVDVWAGELTGAELKILLYICRRTSGFGKVIDAISYRQFCHGIVKRDGTRLDSGAGVSAGSLPKSLTHLEELGLIAVTRRRSHAGDHETNEYRLRWYDADTSEIRTAPRGASKTDAPPVKVRQELMHGTSEPEQPVAKELTQQETAQETEQQEDKPRRSIEERLGDAIALRFGLPHHWGHFARIVAGYSETHDPERVESVITQTLAGWRRGAGSDTDFWALIDRKLAASR